MRKPAVEEQKCPHDDGIVVGDVIAHDEAGPLGGKILHTSEFHVRGHLGQVGQAARDGPYHGGGLVTGIGQLYPTHESSSRE